MRSSSRPGPTSVSSPDDPLEAWLAALDERHLASLTVSEVGRALRALSSCYVERRGRLAEGGALESAGKRAAFALFYGPLHFLVTRHIVSSIPGATEGVREVFDIGCGTGTAGAAWALAARALHVHGIDRHPWAAAEATWTYRQLRLRGHAVQRDAAVVRIDARPGTAVVAAYSINELSDATRASLLRKLIALPACGARTLIVEPIARRATPWWKAWEEAFVKAGGRADEWRFPADLPGRQRQLARAAGLDPRELTARSLYLPAEGGTPIGHGDRDPRKPWPAR